MLMLKNNKHDYTRRALLTVWESLCPLEYNINFNHVCQINQTIYTKKYLLKLTPESSKTGCLKLYNF